MIRLSDVTLFDSLFGKTKEKKLRNLVNKMEKLTKKEDEEICELMNMWSPELFHKILKIIRENGNPKDQDLADEMENKYNDDKLRANDVLRLNVAFIRSCTRFKNKEYNNQYE